MRIAAESITIIIITYFYEYLHFQFAHKNPCSKSFHPFSDKYLEDKDNIRKSVNCSSN